MSVTMIRHQSIGNKIGVVLTEFGRQPFTAHFQLYMQSKDTGSGLLVRSDPYDDEAGAIQMFEAWQKEAALLVAAGDM